MNKQEFVEELKKRLKENPEGVEIEYNHESRWELEVVLAVHKNDYCYYLKRDPEELITTCNLNWKDMRFPEPKREIIELFETCDFLGVKCLCDKSGDYPDFRSKEMLDSVSDDYSLHRKKYITSKEPVMKIYADTFEMVEE